MDKEGIDRMINTMARLQSEVTKKDEIIKGLMQNAESQALTNQVMGKRLLKYETALRNIANFHDPLDMAKKALELPGKIASIEA